MTTSPEILSTTDLQPYIEAAEALHDATLDPNLWYHFVPVEEEYSSPSFRNQRWGVEFHGGIYPISDWIGVWAPVYQEQLPKHKIEQSESGIEFIVIDPIIEDKAKILKSERIALEAALNLVLTVRDFDRLRLNLQMWEDD